MEYSKLDYFQSVSLTLHTPRSVRQKTTRLVIFAVLEIHIYGKSIDKIHSSYKGSWRQQRSEIQSAGNEGKTYLLTKKKNGFYENRDLCDAAGGYLARIMDRNNQEEISKFLLTNKPGDEQLFWIEQPAENDALDDCTAIGLDIRWYSTECDSKHYGICEVTVPVEENSAETSKPNVEKTAAANSAGGDASAKGNAQGSSNAPKEGTQEGVKSTKEGAQENSGASKEGAQEGVKSAKDGEKPTKEGTQEGGKPTKKGIQEGGKPTKEGTQGGEKPTKEGSKESTDAANKVKEEKENPTDAQQKHKASSGSKAKISKGERCNLINFINHFGKNVKISRIANNGIVKDFLIESENYKLNTVFKHVKNVLQMDPVIYQAEDPETGKKLALDGKDSLTLMPADCDGDFIDVIVSPKAVESDPTKEQRSHTKHHIQADSSSPNQLTSTVNSKNAKKKPCEIEVFGGNSQDLCCHFPFKYNDRLYHDCTSTGKRHLWCGTSRDYDNDRQWGYCCLEGECIN